MSDAPAGRFDGRTRLWLLGLLLLVLVLLPASVRADSYTLYLFFTFFVFATFGHAWNLLAGYCGLLSFGNQVFVGLGGFSLAVLRYYGEVNIWLAMLLAGAVSAAFAWLLAIPVRERRQGRFTAIAVVVAVAIWIVYEIAIAYAPGLDVFRSHYTRRVAILLLIFLGALPLLRLQGAYFAVATWLIASAVAAVFSSWGVTGAGAGMQIASSVTLRELYYAALLLLVVMTAVIWRMLRSRYGLALTAVRDDEEAARSVGVDIRAMKCTAFVLGGGATGLAAALYFTNGVFITPESAFPVSWSAYFVFVVVAGGMGTLAGPVVGAAIYVVLDRILAASVGQGLLVLGLASIVVMLVMPRGVVGLLHDVRGGNAASRGRVWQRLSRALLGVSGRGEGRAGPGVVAAFLIPGSPLPLLDPDNPARANLRKGLLAARESVRRLRPDALIIYSTQWVAVLDELWLARPRSLGVHVDENWHDLGELRFDVRADVDFAAACVEGTRRLGIGARAVDFEGFPIDVGTIVAQSFLNPDASIPVVAAANNIYHDFARTRALGEMVAAQADSAGKRVVVVGVGGLSGTELRELPTAGADRVARPADDAWNRDFLRVLETGTAEATVENLAGFVREAKADMGMKHFAFVLGALGGEWRRAQTLGYGPLHGAGGAVVEFRP